MIAQGGFIPPVRAMDYIILILFLQLHMDNYSIFNVLCIILTLTAKNKNDPGKRHGAWFPGIHSLKKCVGINFNFARFEKFSLRAASWRRKAG